MRYYLTPFRMSFIKKYNCWQGCGEKGILVHFGWNLICYNSMEISVEFPQKKE